MMVIGLWGFGTVGGVCYVGRRPDGYDSEICIDLRQIRSLATRWCMTSAIVNDRRDTPLSRCWAACIPLAMNL